MGAFRGIIAGKARRHNACHDVRIFERMAQIRGRLYIQGQREASQENIVHTGGEHALYQIGLMRPETDALKPGSEHNG